MRGYYGLFAFFFAYIFPGITPFPQVVSIRDRYNFDVSDYFKDSERRKSRRSRTPTSLLETKPFSCNIREVLLEGRETAYGVCAAKTTRPYSVEMQSFAKQLTWRNLFALIISDLSSISRNISTIVLDSDSE